MEESNPHDDERSHSRDGHDAEHQDQCTDTGRPETETLHEAQFGVNTGSNTHVGSGSAGEEQSGQQSPLNTLPTSVAGSEIGTSDCSQHTSYQRYEPNAPSTALPQIHNRTEKGLRSTQSSQPTVGSNKTERIDEGREADTQSEGSKKVSKERIVVGRLKKKRSRPITGTQPSRERRIHRPRLSSPLSTSSSSSSQSSSEEWTETDIEPDGSDFVPAKQDCASSLRAVPSTLVYRVSERRSPSRTAPSCHPQSRNTTLEEQDWANRLV
ncbi:MAG: hypothetical protein Q9164_002620 [Protoblastenia rupestris]